jgi:hypothetical protein
MQNSSKLLLVIPMLFLSIWACRKTDLPEAQLAPHEAEYAFPLFNTELKISDLVQNIIQSDTPNDTIIVNQDQTITLIYAADVVEEKATDIFAFFQDGYVPVADTLFFIPLQAPTGITINEAQLSGGDLYLGFRNVSGETLSIRFWIPQLTRNGQMYDTTLTVPPAPFLPVYYGPIPMQGWELTSTDNSMLLRYYAKRTSNGAWFNLNDNGIPGAVLGFQNLTFSFLRGNWGKVEYPLTTDAIDIDINQTNLQGDVRVKNPRITMSLINSFGFPTRGIVKYVRFIGRNGEVIPLESTVIMPGTETGIDFAYPSFEAGEVGQAKVTTFYFDDTNSNIEDIFAAQPTRMEYEVAGLANATSEPIIGFITDSSSVRLNVRVELLLEGQMRDFAANQTVDLDFSDLGSGAIGSTTFTEAEFKLVTENTIPLANDMQIYFQDAAGAVVDSLFANGPQTVIAAAPVDPATGLVTDSARKETFIPMTADRFTRLRDQAKKTYFTTRFTTSNDGTIPVKILNNQTTQVRMGVRLKITNE